MRALRRLVETEALLRRLTASASGAKQLRPDVVESRTGNRLAVDRDR